MRRRLNCNRIAHKVIVEQIKPSVYTVKSGRLPNSRAVERNNASQVSDHVPCFGVAATLLETYLVVTICICGFFQVPLRTASPGM
jgi:hypothetical protein